MTNVHIQSERPHGNHNSATLRTYIMEYVYAKGMRYGLGGSYNFDFTDEGAC